MTTSYAHFTVHYQHAVFVLRLAEAIHSIPKARRAHTSDSCLSRTIASIVPVSSLSSNILQGMQVGDKFAGSRHRRLAAHARQGQRTDKWRDKILLRQGDLSFRYVPRELECLPGPRLDC